MNSWVNIFSLVYPVGSIYETTNDALGPNILFGLEGQWELIGTRTVGESGEKTIYTYERVWSESPNRTHLYALYNELIKLYNDTTDEDRKEELNNLINETKRELADLGIIVDSFKPMN